MSRATTEGAGLLTYTDQQPPIGNFWLYMGGADLVSLSIILCVYVPPSSRSVFFCHFFFNSAINLIINC